MRLLYYISSHGFGHGVRACAVINALAPEVEVTVRSGLSPEFFAEELSRPYRYEPAVFDCGCVQLDSVVVAIRETLEQYAELTLRNRARLAAEVAWCRRQKFQVIASDIVPFAFEVGSGAGIPTVAISNFTWYEIYSPYLNQFPEFSPLVEEMRRQYASATLLLELTPPNPMEYFPCRQRVGLVGRVGTPCSGELRQRFNLPPDHRLGLIYPGNYGLGEISWQGLARFAHWSFLGLYPLPGQPANYHLLPAGAFSYRDVAASVDLVVSKLGYATIAECMLNGVPLLYLPRDDFAEYEFLKSAVDQWGFGYALAADRYRALEWGELLASLPGRERIPKAAPTGARDCALRLAQLAKAAR